MKKVLITGASGFIGRHCLPFLKERGFEICATSSKAQLDTTDIKWIHLDLLKSLSFKELMAQVAPTHLLHLAWNCEPRKCWNSVDNLNWLKKSTDLLEAFVQQGGARVVMAGTCAEYNWNASPIDETTMTHAPHSLYGSCKLALHLVLESFASQMGISHAWGRVFYLFGPHESSQRFVPVIIRGLLKKEPIPCSHGNQIRDFLHVTDVAEAFVALLDSQVKGAVNIGSGQGVTLLEVAKKITENLGGKDLLHFGALSAPLIDPPKIIANTTRLREELQWSPKYLLEEGLKQTISWWENEMISMRDDHVN